MTEFCKSCFQKLNSDIIKDKKLILSKDNDLCEDCGELKPVVVDIVEKDGLLKRLFRGRW